MDSAETTWANLASRAMRVLLARKGLGYAHLAAELGRIGEGESARSVEGKIQRGTYRFSFFLQSLQAVRADCPRHWLRPLSHPGTWGERAALVFRQELDGRPWMTWPELSRRLAVIGEVIAPDALAEQVTSGTYQATLFFQCAALCGFSGLEQFLDLSDLHEAAREGAAMRKMAGSS